MQPERHRGPIDLEGHPTLTIGDNRRHLLARTQLRPESQSIVVVRVPVFVFVAILFVFLDARGLRLMIIIGPRDAGH